MCNSPKLAYSERYALVSFLLQASPSIVLLSKPFADETKNPIMQAIFTTRSFVTIYAVLAPWYHSSCLAVS